MRELSLNILDIAQNSIRAKATIIKIKIVAKDNILTIEIGDNGCGMSEQLLQTVTNPYSTTRKTRKVGLGIPLLKMASENSGGKFTIQSTEGVGTTVNASFCIDNIDRPPLGDIASTFVDLIYQEPTIDFLLDCTVQNENFVVDTSQIKQLLQDVPITEFETIQYIKDMINDNLAELSGGNL